ncbi:hypothetical protein RhiJN_22956 [Ceratobasidium sp. AG-Ba]|nr:hypothetical protein RhiJN_22956 [Ceratobasidium sp. AG-Ba]
MKNIGRWDDDRRDPVTGRQGSATRRYVDNGGSSKPPARASAPPGNRSASVSSNPSRPTPAPEDLVNAHGILGPQQASTVNSRGNAGEPVASAPNGSGKLESDRASRPSLALERKVNELASTIEEFRATNTEHLKEIQSTLAAIRATIDRLEASVANARAASSSATPPPLLPPIYAHPVLDDVKPTIMSNPPLTPDMSAIISKVVSEARSRVGKKKSGVPEDNSVKEHARKTFYRMLRIPAAGSVRGYFLDAHGQPDTLPAQFVDPDTQYCQPYPHWGEKLTKQMAWVPTYVSQFKGTIPKDQSELSKTLTNLSDEQIIILLNDGPFKTSSATFKANQKTPAELKQLQSRARKYQRGERKVTICSKYIRDLASFPPPDWAFLTHSGYMSVDSSDDEGNLVTKVPSTRSQWVTNVYRAIGVAEYVRSNGKFAPPTKTQIVDGPIPHLESGTGSGKMTLRIAECAISKSWRASHPDDFAKSAHLINASETIKPNVLDFLERYPLSLLNRNKDDIAVKEEGYVNAGTKEHMPFEWNQPAPIEYDGDEESGGILEVLELQEAATAGTKTGLTTSDIPIDPQLLDAPAHGNGPLAGPPFHHESSPPPIGAALGNILAGVDSEMHPPPPPLTSGMPPPPPLPPITMTNPIQATSTQENLVNDQDQTDGVSSELPPKKRRGRPPGSRNKKKQKTTETTEA